MKLHAKNCIAGIYVFIIIVINPDFVYTQGIEIKKIWDEAPHNAFTDIIRYESNFYCTFREGRNHVPHDTTENGRIRILRSGDGENWMPVALLTSRKYDLREFQKNPQ